MKRIILLIILGLCIFIPNCSLGKDNLLIKTEKEEIKQNETFKIYINIEEIEVSAYTLNIYFDNEKLEYISGPENTNIINNRILNVWFDETGGSNFKKNQTIAEFEFKAKEIGNSNISVIGEMYNKNGDKIETNNSSIKLNIVQNTELNINQNDYIDEEKNSNLKIMRLSQEGITPEFSPDITEYYFITDLNTQNLDVTAIPQYSNANIKISGNDNLKQGNNKIIIEVSLPDSEEKTIYTINVTKTDNKKQANTNLEILAIENQILEPLFDTNILEYKVEISNSIQNLNVFAVPENMDAKIEIQGGDNLVEGNNLIVVKVIAQNGYTFKNYNVNVYKRNVDEENEYQQELKLNSEKLTSTTQQNVNYDEVENRNIENYENNNENSIKQKWSKNKSYIIIVFLFIVLVVVVCVFVYKKKFK